MRNPAVLFAQTPEVRIGYFEFGSRSGTPLILLHGFPDSPLAWNKVIERLDTRRLRVLVPFLRGFGPTEVLKPDLVAGQEAALGIDALAFAQALELPRFHLAGHDWGARAAYAAAVLSPGRLLSLAGIGTSWVQYGGGDPPPNQIHAMWYQWFFQLNRAQKALAEHTEPFCRELWHAWSPSWKFSRSEFADAARAWKNPQFVDTVLHYYRTRHGGALSVPAYEDAQSQLNTKPAPKISVPTLFIQGGVDAVDLPAGSVGQGAWFTGPYTAAVAKESGHFPHREEPRMVARLLSAHVRKYS